MILGRVYTQNKMLYFHKVKFIQNVYIHMFVCLLYNVIIIFSCVYTYMSVRHYCKR